MDRDPDKDRKPEYDWVQPKTLNLITAIVTGVCGGFVQGVKTDIDKVDVWDCPEGIQLFRWFLFGRGA
jgi:hypothetical protein